MFYRVSVHTALNSRTMRIMKAALTITTSPQSNTRRYKRTPQPSLSYLSGTRSRHGVSENRIDPPLPSTFNTNAHARRHPPAIWMSCTCTRAPAPLQPPSLAAASARIKLCYHAIYINPFQACVASYPRLSRLLAGKLPSLCTCRPKLPAPFVLSARRTPRLAASHGLTSFARPLWSFPQPAAGHQSGDG